MGCPELGVRVRIRSAVFIYPSCQKFDTRGIYNTGFRTIYADRAEGAQECGSNDLVT